MHDPEVGPSIQADVEDKSERDYNDTLVALPKMLEMDFNKVENLLANIAATNPFRPDAAFGKQPDVAAIDASSDLQSTPVAPVEGGADGSYVHKLKEVNNMLAGYDIKLQQASMKLPLSRSGPKPDLYNIGIEYEQLMTFVRQTEYHMSETIKLIPETLPENTGEPIAKLMPEFSLSLAKFDIEFQQIYDAVQHEIEQAELALKSN